MKPLSIFLSRGKQNPSGQGDTNSVLGGTFRDYLRENRDFTKLRRRWQRPERQKSNRFNEHHAFLYISLPSLDNRDVNGPNYKLTWERKRQDDKFYYVRHNSGAVSSLQLQPKFPSFK